MNVKQDVEKVLSRTLILQNKTVLKRRNISDNKETCHSTSHLNHTVFLFSVHVNELQIYWDVFPSGVGRSRFIDAYVKPVKKKKKKKTPSRCSGVLNVFASYILMILQ